MLAHGGERRFFPGSYAFLGKLSNQEYSEERCVIEKYVAEKDRWVVKLWHDKFQGECILVKAQNVRFDCYALQCEDVPPMPSHVRIQDAGKCGKALVTLIDFDTGATVFEEMPILVVANHGDDNAFEARWNLNFAVENERGPKCAVMQAFEEMADGGVVDEYRADAATMFDKILKTSGRSPQDIANFKENQSDFVGEEVVRIASVLSRWQTNSHNFCVSEQDQSGLFRWASKMLHSCGPNCQINVDPNTGLCIVTALRPIRSGEQLTNDYMGGDPAFHAAGVEERRKQLKKRGFVCSCSRCTEESGEA